MQHEKGGLREGHGKEASQSAIKQPILLFPVKDKQSLRQSQREAAIPALDGSAHWPAPRTPTQRQEYILIGSGAISSAVITHASCRSEEHTSELQSQR